MVDPYTPKEIGFRRRFALITTVIGVVAGLLFLAFPDIDLAISRELRICPGAKAFAPWCVADPGVETLRNLFIVVTVLIGLVVVAGLVRTLRKEGKFFGLAQARWWYLLIVLGVGPGLVANVMLKDHWGRARPLTVAEFGGTKNFTPPLLLSNECHRNCSFVSGEVSSVTVPFFAAALLLPQLRAVLIGSGVALGFAAGLVRISQGGHFMSDVLFAGIFMALTASALHMLLIGLWRRRGLDEILAPYLRPVRDALAPYLRPMGDVLKGYLNALRGVLAPYVRSVRDAVEPHLSAVESKLSPILARLRRMTAPSVRYLRESWGEPPQRPVASLAPSPDQAQS